jgi:hypothetical protein
MLAALFFLAFRYKALRLALALMKSAVAIVASDSIRQKRKNH